MTALLEVALAATAAGLTVVPPRQDGTKAPDGRWREYETTPPTVAQLDAWYANGGRTGIGLVTGATSGNLEMLEFEGRAIDLWPAFRDACRNAGIPIDEIVRGYSERTPGGGLHLLYRCDGPIEGNQKLARRLEEHGQIEVLIETRGEGGYVVVAPSNGGVHPTGGKWELLAGGFDHIVRITAEGRRRLLEVARTFDEIPTTAPEPTRATPSSTPGPVGDSWMDQVVHDFNQATSWAQILPAAGWTHHHRHGQIDYWTRPGKEARDGHSATTNANGTDRLIVFSSSVAGFDTADGQGPATTYDRFGAWAVLAHAGDRAQAAHRANERGCGPQRTPRTPEGDLHDLIGQPAATVDQADDGLAPGRSWQRTPLADLIHGLQTGTLQAPTPTLGTFHSGVGALWYPGRVNGLYGEPGKGKTWIALCVAAQQLLDGHAVAWIDLEEPAQGIVTRLLDLGVPGPTIVDRFAHYAPEETIGLAAAMANDLAELHPTFVVIDSTGEALALEGAKPNNDDEVANWFRTWPRWIATTTGAGVVQIDHVIKNENERGLWPGGSQRKKAAINGAAFMAEPIHELGRGHEGRLKLTTAKDRQGYHRTKTKAAEFILDATGTRLTWRLEAPTRPADPSAPFRPTGLMEKISRALEDADGGLTKRRLADQVKGKSEYRRIALETLITEGYVHAEILDREHHCTSVRPYRETDDILPTEPGEMT